MPGQALSLGRLAGISGYFAVQDGPADPADGWHPATALLEDGGDLLAAAAGLLNERLAAPRPWVTASVLHLGYAARLTSIYAGCLTLDGAAPDLAASRICYRVPPSGPVDMIIDPVTALDAQQAWRRLYDDHLRPLGDVARARFRISRRVLDGNIASALGGSLATLARTGHGTLGELTAQPWAHPADLAASGSWTPGPRFVRATCCGYERVPGGGRCGDCSLTALGVPDRPRQ